MFSRRVPADFTENSIARALRARTRPFIDLTQTNPTAAGLSPSDGEIVRALSRPGLASYRPEPKGLRSAREAIRAEYARRGVEADPEKLFVMASTSEAYAFLFKLLCDPGDFVLVPAPSYPLFDHLTDLEGVRRRTYPLSRVADGGWRLAISEVAAGFRDGARAVLLVHPNNPTGSYVKKDEMLDIGRILDPGAAAVVSDEVFADFRLRPATEPALGVAASDREEPAVLTFSLSGLSKSFALPQMKLAWILVGGPPEAVALASERLELIADTYLSASTPVQMALPALFEIGRFAAERLRERLSENVASASEAFGQTLLPEGGWSLPIELPPEAEEERIVLELLESRDVRVSPGWFFDFETPHLVVSLLTPRDDFREGVSRIGEFLSR